MGHYGHKTSSLKLSFNLETMLWFLGVISKHASKFQRRWFGPYIIQYCSPNNIVLLVTIDKFDPNPIFININKLKPYKFIEDKTLQLVFANPSDLVTNKPIKTKEPKPLPVENANFELVEFKSINNYLTHGNIIGTNVLVRCHNDVPIVFNYVLSYNDQNNAFNKEPIDVYNLEMYNPKSIVYHSHKVIISWKVIKNRHILCLAFSFF